MMRSWIATILRTLKKPVTGKVFDGPVTVPLYVIVIFFVTLIGFLLGRYWLNYGKWHTLVSHQYKYSIDYPANWSSNTYGENGSRGSDYLRAGFGDFFTSKGLYIYEQKMDEPSLLKAVEWSQEIIEREGGYQLSELKETVVGQGNYPAMVRTFRARDLIGQQLFYKAVYIATNERVFMLEFSAYTRSYDEATVTFDDMLDSFQLIEPQER